ncbi:hypothetical protein RHSIM_Rhsim01G0252200 [Rhododendron simsii]|uniref:Uncharacterized protein n=1 Tax=Rhododendron simsii TaxID=118357 RepID=A0A834HK24_RHOSS|nr:hypothetical protein RHSIM_Rhsim01G0252200 [Rhododendron simsii]
MLGRQPELGRQTELLENQPELSWSTGNPAVVLATIAVLVALAGVKFQNSSDNPFHSRPATVTVLVTALLIFGFAAARIRPIILDRKQQQILMLNSLVQISGVVCLACIVSFFIPNGLGWNVYVACASTLCVGVAVWDILRNFAPSCVVRLLPCMGPTGSNGGSEKNDGVSDCGNDGRNRIAESNGSPVSGSSLVWENQSSSQQGGTSSSNTGSHSSHCKAEQSQLKHTCEHGVPSHQTDHSTQANGKTANNNAVSPHIIQFSPNKGTMSKAHLDPDEKPTQSPNPLKAAGGDKSPGVDGSGGENARRAHEFFRLLVEEKMKLYSDDPAKTMRLSTSFNVKKEPTSFNVKKQVELGRQPELTVGTPTRTVGGKPFGGLAGVSPTHGGCTSALGGNDGRNRIVESNGSPVCGSSLVSENQSSSQQELLENQPEQLRENPSVVLATIAVLFALAGVSSSD